MTDLAISADFESLGFEMHRAVLNVHEQRAILAAIPPQPSAGQRRLLAIPAVAALARGEKLATLVHPHVGGKPRPVRAIFFDKSPDANWAVPWHQDLTIAVRRRVDAPGFSGWSTKAGVPHVQPPAELLARMLAVRIHFDDADESNGALRVLPGSHRFGRLSDDDADRWVAEGEEFICSASAGETLLMRPLLLHASSRATQPTHRRVLHIEYAAGELPGNLEWHGEC